MPWRANEPPPCGWFGQRARLASRHARAPTYCSPVCPDLYRSCTGRGPAGGSRAGLLLCLPMSRRDYDRAPAAPSSDGVRVLRTERRPTDRVGTGWASARHLPTPCPHSPLSRPHPHRFRNNDSCERRLRRHPAVPGILRHPRKSVTGTIRPNPRGIPRENAKNNKQQKLLRLIVDQVLVRGWRVEIKFRIPLEEPPTPPHRALSSKDRLRSLGINERREFPPQPQPRARKGHRELIPAPSTAGNYGRAAPSLRFRPPPAPQASSRPPSDHLTRSTAVAAFCSALRPGFPPPLTPASGGIRKTIV